MEKPKVQRSAAKGAFGAFESLWFNHARYNDAGLLVSATNPETGTVTYSYNADNTLATKQFLDNSLRGL